MFIKSKKKKLLCACCAACISLQAQSITLKGNVKSFETKTPLESVNIVVPNTEFGTTTDINGDFLLEKMIVKNLQLQISMIGYKDTTFNIAINNDIVDIGQIFLKSEVLQLDGVNVHGHNDLIQTTMLSDTFLSGKKMQENMQGTIAQTLQNELGVNIRAMGQATTRPILRGYSGDRFLITKNGIKTGDLSHSSADHAMSLDLGGVEEIQIFRGPRALLYGSNTIGGVVNIEKNSISTEPLDHLYTYFTSGVDSGNDGFLGTIAIETPYKSNNIRFSLIKRKTGDQSTPKGVLQNTSMNNIEGFMGFSKLGNGKRSTFSFERVLMDYGIPGSPQGHISGVDLKLSKNTQEFNYHQDIDLMGFETFNIDQNFIYYSHSEYESTSSDPAVRLSQNIVSLKSTMTGQNREFGGSFDYRAFSAGGFYWTPNTDEIKMSFFGLQEKEFLGLTAQLSFRAEHSTIAPTVTTKFSNLKTEDVIKKKFNFVSLAASAIKKWETWQWSNTVMRAGKTPDIENLYSDGPHLGSYSYEIGNPLLPIEETYGFESSLQYENDKFFLLLNGFLNQSPSYHQFTKLGDGYIPGADWIEWGSGASGWLYIYQIEATKSQISGGEIKSSYVGDKINVSADFSFVRGLDISRDGFLSFMPADKLQLTFSTKEDQDLSTSLRFVKGLEQNRLGKFETMTPEYFLIDIFGSYTFESKKGTRRLAFNIHNLLNETYYNHLSKIKTIMPESGRKVSLQYRYLF